MLALDHHFDFKGQSVAWGVIGDGEPLVLIHGTPFSSQVWRRIAPLLARKWRVYYFDLCGYGQSEKREGLDVSLGVQNELLSALVYHWQLVKPAILAHDFGGATALRAHYLNGLDYAQLTLVDPVALSPWGSPFVQHVRKHEAAFAGNPDYIHDAVLRAYIQGAAYNKLDEEALSVYMGPWQGDVGKAAFYRQIGQMDQRYTNEISVQYSPMECPLHIIWGEEDTWIPLSQGKKLAEALNNGRISIVPSAGHLVQEDRPEAIVAAML
ncbi:alpha/beta hydrolase [Kiloniella spongiae]|uniref:Alpha/beta hydrolase n=1 Tax=Kiloniella spongiae TaxID=1489064 RepID=A0A0H2MIB7_9PROT|nr:alpha/beta hydrolase [Kiloniella spongiae]KLN60482.1 alpha/beta hydrolase [Kiloniella spongiae]